ncbi:Crp/Fnr family transcriptional regulator [Flavitalea antarctica]
MELIDPIQHFRQVVERYVKIPEADWNLLASEVELKELKKYDCFATEGKRTGEVAFVVSGSFRQYYSKDGEEKTTYFYFPADLMCAYVSCITGQPSQLTIEALTDGEVLSFPYAALLHLYKQSHAWQTFGRLIAEYIAIGLEERMVSLLIQSPEERYRDLLSGNKKKIIEQIPQQYVANYLGITPVSMSRIRKRITER